MYIRVHRGRTDDAGINNPEYHERINNLASWQTLRGPYFSQILQRYKWERGQETDKQFGATNDN